MLLKSPSLVGGGTIYGDLTVTGSSTISGSTVYEGAQTIKVDAESFILNLEAYGTSVYSGLKLAAAKGSAASPSDINADDYKLGRIMFSGHEGTFYSGAEIIGETAGVWAADSFPTDLVFKTAATGSNTPAERMRITQAGDVVVGNEAAVTHDSQTCSFNVVGTGGADTNMALGRWSTDISGANLKFIKSRHGTIGSNTILVDNDELGSIKWIASDGTDSETIGAFIQARVDGTPGGNDMPTELVFATTPDGGAAPTERMYITPAGKIGIGGAATGHFTVNLPSDGNFMHLNHGGMTAFKILRDADDHTIINQTRGNSSRIRIHTQTGTGLVIRGGASTDGEAQVAGVNLLGMGTETPSAGFHLKGDWNGVIEKLANQDGVESLRVTDAAIEPYVPISIGTIEAAADSGDITLFNMPVTSSSSDGDSMSASLSIDSEPILKVKALSDGAGGIDTKTVTINGDTTIEGNVEITGENALLLSNSVNDNVTPTLAFGDGDTGFFETAANELCVSIAGTCYFKFGLAGIHGADTSEFLCNINPSSATVPAFTFNGDDNTGVGRHSEDNVCLIAGGAEGVRVEDPADLASTETSLWIRDEDGDEMKQVSVGADDSGGSGFKYLRIAN